MSIMPLDPQRIVFSGSEFLIYDIVDLLPRHPKFPFGSEAINPNTGKRDVRGSYQEVPGRMIKTIIYHQTAGGYGRFDKQVFKTASFFVRNPTWKKNPRYGQPKQPEWLWTGEGRGWPGFAYTWFVPFDPTTMFTDRSRSVIYQCNHLDFVTWHTGDGQNEGGGGCAFQGYFLEPGEVNHPMKGYDGHPSAIQMKIAELFWLEYAVPVLGASVLTGHWEHGKLACPGEDLREKVQELRGYA